MHFSANKKGAYLLLLYSLGSFTYSIPLIKLLHESKWDVVWQGIYCIFVYSVIWWLYPKTMQRLTVWCAQSCAKHTSRRPDRICFSWSILKPPVLHNFTKGHEKKGLLMRKKKYCNHSCVYFLLNWTIWTAFAVSTAEHLIEIDFDIWLVYSFYYQNPKSKMLWIQILISVKKRKHEEHAVHYTVKEC